VDTYRFIRCCHIVVYLPLFWWFYRCGFPDTLHLPADGDVHLPPPLPFAPHSDYVGLPVLLRSDRVNILRYSSLHSHGRLLIAEGDNTFTHNATFTLHTRTPRLFCYLTRLRTCLRTLQSTLYSTVLHFCCEHARSTGYLLHLLFHSYGYVNTTRFNVGFGSALRCTLVTLPFGLLLICGRLLTQLRTFVTYPTTRFTSRYTFYPV